VSASVSFGGSGGDAGPGGAGGFGGGGGKGGDLGADGANGTYAPVKNGRLEYAIASGGDAGFGAGAGSRGDTEQPPNPNGFKGQGGAGLGGAVFVANGGILNINGPSFFCGNEATEGGSSNGGGAGFAAGTDLFMMTGSTVTIDPGAANAVVFNGSIADDSGSTSDNYSVARGSGAGLTLNSGLLVLNGSNTYSGATIVQGSLASQPVVQATDGIGINPSSFVQLNGGIWQGNGELSRFLGTGPGRLQFGVGLPGGFSSSGGDFIVSLNCGASLTWGQPNFISSGSALLFGSTTATNDVIFNNNLDLAGANQTILATANSNDTNRAVLEGVISDGSLTLGDATHTGIIVLAADETYLGPTQINGGSVLLTGTLQSTSVGIASGGTLEDVSGGLANGTALLVDGTFILDVNDSIDTLTGSGTVELSGGSLTLNSGTFSGAITGTDPAFGLNKISAGTLTLSGANTYVGPTNIIGGTLTLTGSLMSLSINVAPGAIFNDNNNAPDTQATLTNAGTVNLGSNDTIATLIKLFSGLSPCTLKEQSTGLKPARAF